MQLLIMVQAVVKPPMAKIANVFGRLEAFSISVFLYVVGYIQMAGSNNVKTFASAQIFYSAGNTGLQILQQIFIADTSDLLNRALFSSLPDVPFLITVWAAEGLESQSTPAFRIQKPPVGQWHQIFVVRTGCHGLAAALCRHLLDPHPAHSCCQG